MPEKKSCFDEVYTNPVVQGYAKKLLSRMGMLFPFLSNSKEDFLQEMWIAVNDSLKRYDPNRNASVTTFTCLVMQRALYSSVKRELRVRNHEFFLDDLVNPENKDGEVDKENTSIHVPTETGCIDGFPFSLTEFYDILDNMPPLERTICRKIMEGKSLHEISLELKLPHTNFYKNIMPALRTHFKQLAGMF